MESVDYEGALFCRGCERHFVFDPHLNRFVECLKFPVKTSDQGDSGTCVDDCPDKISQHGSVGPLKRLVERKIGSPGGSGGTQAGAGGDGKTIRVSDEHYTKAEIDDRFRSLLSLVEAMHKAVEFMGRHPKQEIILLDFQKSLDELRDKYLPGDTTFPDSSFTTKSG